MSYLNSYQKGAIFFQKHKLIYTTLVISGSAGVATSVKRKYIECKLGGKVTSKKYNLNNMLKKDKIGKKYSTKLKGKTITIKKASKTYLEVSCKSFPQEV